LIAGAIILFVTVFLLWRHFSSYESTDDAQVDGHLNSISARVSGHVLKRLVEDNQFVQAGTPLIQIDPSDYQVALDRAKAAYADALATAQAAQVNVPITSVGTASQVISAKVMWRMRTRESPGPGSNWMRPERRRMRHKQMT